MLNEYSVAKEGCQIFIEVKLQKERKRLTRFSVPSEIATYYKHYEEVKGQCVETKRHLAKLMK